jgi:hypothetical protein
VYDAKGQELATLVNTRLERGEHRTVWMTQNMAQTLTDGVYFYRIITERGSEAGKIVLVR